ncbi:hypothetical protein [Endozoicomonas sp. SESOKO2]|uniref:hypothetical protein n=2 Tax=unclassified Endozoicomonas TaxID=2644528 RepID=UPI002148F8C7|nr:hypothetical protein [Endozoicomonas sp. SESOKO2]
MLKNSPFETLLLLILLLSVVCQAKPWTERFIVEPEHKAVFTDQSFSIKDVQHTLPVNPSDIVDTNGCAAQDLPPDDQSFYGIKATIIESISWRSIYTTHLLLGYELPLNIEEAPLSNTLHSWLPLEVVIAVGWFLKSYWLLYSSSFNTIKQKEATSKLTQGDHLFATIIMVPGSGHNQQPYPLSESSDEQVSGVTTQLAGTVSRSLHSDSGGGNRGPQQPPHTLGLNCFVFPCRGVCIFRSSSNSRWPAKWPLNSEESSAGNLANSISSGTVYATDSAGPNYATTMQRNLPITPEDWIIIDGLLNLRSCNLPEAIWISCSATHFERPVATSTPGYLPSEGPGHYQQAHSNQKRRDHTGPQTCDANVIGKNGQPRPCGRTCKSPHALSDHKNKYHSGQKICQTTTVGEDGQPRPCGKICKNTQVLSDHRRRDHSGQKSCDRTVFGKDGRPQPCGKIYKNAKALSDHKRKSHSGQKICDVTVVSDVGQLRPCGVVCISSQALFNHKRSHRKRKLVDTDQNVDLSH